MVTFSIFNADGSLQSDLTKRLPKFLGSYYIDGSQQNGSIYHAEFNPGRPFILCLEWPAGPGNAPYARFDSDRIYWWYNQPIGQYTPLRVAFDYGVY